MLLSDAKARYDDLNEGQLGDVLFERPPATEIAIFGSKAIAAAQASPPPWPPSPARVPFDGGLGAARYGAAACCRSGGAGGPRLRLRRRRTVILPNRQPWQRGRWRCRCSPPASMGSAFQRTASRFSGRGGPVAGHAVPAAGGVHSTRAFRALPTRTIRTVGGDASNFGTHSVRPGAGAALFHADAPRPLDTQALQHASAWTDESYILESAELTAVAVAPRMPPSGRPPGAATTLDPPPGPGVRSNGISAPPAGRLRLLPAGAPQHGGPSGARMAGVVAPLGGVLSAAGRQPPPPMVGSGGGAAACGRSMFALPAAAYGRGARLLTDMERGCLRRRSSRLLLTDAAVPPYVRTAGWHGPDRLECGRP